MKILILHQHFKSPYRGGAIRSYYLAKALVDRGLEVIVIAGDSDSGTVRETIDGIDVHYLPIAYGNQFGFWKRSFSFLRYASGAMRVAGKFRDAQLCYAISVPLTVGLAALWIKKRYKIPYLFEVGDLWPDAPIQLGFVQNYVLQKALLHLEKTFYKSAEAVIALSPMIAAAVIKKTPGIKVQQIPNMADTEFYKPEKKNPYLESKFGVEGKFVVSYIGAAGFANGLDFYVECARSAQKAALPIHFLFCGEGAKLEYLQNIVKRLGLTNFTFVPFQNRVGVNEVMNVTDASFVCYKNVPILETGSPNKYFDALSAGKLVVINFEGWIKKDIEANRCGLAVDGRHPTDFNKQIIPFLQNQKLLDEYKANARTLAEAKYSRKILGEAFYKVISETAASCC